MKKLGWMAGWLVLGAAVTYGQTAVVTHAELQAVTSTGTSAWVESFPFTIRGVIVNDPEEMLDPAYKPGATGPSNGGQYQLFIQAVATGDRGGTALYMSQMSFLGDNYDEATWSNEMRRVMYDANGRKFRKGDRVEVTARKALFYNGKRNINEAHRTLVENNFDVALVKANVGVPQAEALTLADLKNPDNSAIFDSSRATGGEHWQGMRTRLDGIRLTNTNGWGKTNWSDRVCTAADDTGRTLPLRMPLADLGPAPATSTWFSATGILNQEGGNTNGYELFVQEIRPVLNILSSSVNGVAVGFAADYEGYVLEYSDDQLNTWTNLDATPVKVIVIEDVTAPTNRMYRLRKVD
jgi:hypothetical protein